MANTNLLRLDQINVQGLFGMFDHCIELQLEERVTLLHGPNGVGKTSILRMTDALLRGKFGHFRTIPFDQFDLRFQGGSTLTLQKHENASNPRSTHLLSLSIADEVKSANLDLSPTTAQKIAGRIDFLRQFDESGDTWIDIRDDEVLSGLEVVSRYGNSNAELKNDERIPPDWFRTFSRRAKTHLIEAQRLIKTRPSRSQRYYIGRGATPTISTVFECGSDFQKRLAETMADYGRQAQSLDQSFPQRLISAREMLAPEDLQERMNKLDRQTAEFKKIGILDEAPLHPFDVSSLGSTEDTTQTRVMTLYVRDTEQKLKALDDLASRTRLFLEIVNKKYRHKKINLDREEGLVAAGEGNQRVPLDSLSSGEQHELVLLYDLLFRVAPNTVVLIDEPELSLHVAWQKQFLPDLLDVVDLSQFDVLVATHSPYIVGDSEELMVALSDSE